MPKKRKFICNICDKQYASASSLCNHNKRIHNIIKRGIKHHKIMNNSEKSTSPNINDGKCKKNECGEINKNGEKTTSESTNDEYDISLRTTVYTFNCDYCSNKYKHKQSKYRHQSVCIYNSNKPENMEREIKRRTNQLQSCSSSSSTINNINNNTTNNTTNIENQNNGTINNTQNTQNVNIYLSIGKEDMANTLTDEEQIEVIKQQFNSLLYLVALTHAGNKYPQFNNSKITDLNRNIGYKYDDETNDFIATDKKEMLDDIVDERTNDINNFMDFHKDKIDKKILKNTQRFIDNINDSENDNNTLLKSHLTKLNHMLYNHTKK